MFKPAWIPLSLLVVACAADPAQEDDSADAADDTGGTSEGSAGTADDGVSDTMVADDSSGDAMTSGDPPGAVPEFGGTFTVVGTSEHGLDVVRDLAFNPDAPDQLWTYNMLMHGTVIFFDPGTEAQTSEVRVDAYAQHFMAYVSSAAFGSSGRFATCQESRDEWNVGPQAPDDFMGPSLWPSDLNVYATVGQALPPENQQEGSHLDMLHQSPLCMGIAHDVDNVYWVFDGSHGNLVRYDFQQDHGPGGGDHSDGIITRYSDATVTRVENIPSHMALDHDTGMLYVADTGSGRVMRLDTTTGTNIGPLTGDWDGAQYDGVEGADFTVVVEGLDAPSGLVLSKDRIFVSEHGTGDIIALDLEGTELDRMSTPADQIMGITIGPQGSLWYADAGANEIVRVDP